jgi:glutamate dehydrogenase/leucine dehydrogenase/predicted amidohydrolase
MRYNMKSLSLFLLVSYLTTIFSPLDLSFAKSSSSALRPAFSNLNLSSHIADSISQDSINDSHKSVLDIVSDQMKRIVKKTGLSDDVLGILKKPKRTSDITFEIIRDDDKTPYTGKFVRANHSDSIGVPKGGIRYTIDLNESDAQGLAFLMTIKCAGMGLPMGGGKGEAQIDINELNQNETARATKECVWRIMDKYQALGEDVDVPAPDKNTGKTIMAYAEEALLAWHIINNSLKNKTALGLLLKDADVIESLEYYKDDAIRMRKKYDEKGSIVADAKTPILNAVIGLHNKGYIIQELASFTDKPLDRGGAEGREEATGLGGYYAEAGALEHYSRIPGSHFFNKKRANGLWHCLRGFGNVGLEYARICHKNKGKFAAIQIYKSGIKYTGPKTGPGIDIEKLISFIEAERKKIYEQKISEANTANMKMTEQDMDDLWELIQKKDIDLSAYKQKGVVPLDIQNGEDVIDIEADILVEAATQSTIHALNANRVSQKMILELGNATTTGMADNILAEKGVIIIPDVLANAGGVTVSMYEMKQNITGQRWPLELTYARLEERIKRAVDAMFKIQQENTHYRLSNRDAYWLLSLKRVLAAMESDMWHHNDPLLEKFISYHDTVLHDIYTSPQTDYELRNIHASGIAYMQEAIDREEYERSRNLNSIIDRMVNFFDIGNNKDGIKVCLFGGPTGYKTQATRNIIEHLNNAYGISGVYYDLDFEGNTDKLPFLLQGKRVEGIKVLDRETRMLCEASMQLRPGDILVAEGDFAIANHTLSLIPDDIKHFSIAVDINPCMNVKINEHKNLMLTNDDYTLLREMLVGFFQRPEKFDPYNSFVHSLEHRRLAVSSIYATFRNRAAELYNTYDPFELMFSREIAMPILNQVLSDAQSVLNQTDREDSDYKTAEKVYTTSQRLITILKKMPDISGRHLMLPRSHGLRQILPEEMYSKRYIPENKNANPDRTSSAGTDYPEYAGGLPVKWFIEKSDNDFKTALVQISEDRFSNNTDKIIEIIYALSELGVNAPDLVVFPELIDEVFYPMDHEKRRELIEKAVRETKITAAYCMERIDKSRPNDYKVSYALTSYDGNTVNTKEIKKFKQEEENRIISIRGRNGKEYKIAFLICMEAEHILTKSSFRRKIDDDIMNADLLIVAAGTDSMESKWWPDRLFGYYEGHVPVAFVNLSGGSPLSRPVTSYTLKDTRINLSNNDSILMIGIAGDNPVSGHDMGPAFISLERDSYIKAAISTAA